MKLGDVASSVCGGWTGTRVRCFFFATGDVMLEVPAVQTATRSETNRLYRRGEVVFQWMERMMIY